MIIMTIVQQLLYAIELAVSPIFIGLWLIPGLTECGDAIFYGLGRNPALALGLGRE